MPSTKIQPCFSQIVRNQDIPAKAYNRYLEKRSAEPNVSGFAFSPPNHCHVLFTAELVPSFRYWSGHHRDYCSDRLHGEVQVSRRDGSNARTQSGGMED